MQQHSTGGSSNSSNSSGSRSGRSGAPGRGGRRSYSSGSGSGGRGQGGRGGRSAGGSGRPGSFSRGSSSAGRGGRPGGQRGGGGGRSGGGQKRRGQYIDPSRFVNEAVTVAEEKPFTPIHKFSDFALFPELKKAVLDRGFTNPTPIQDEAIPVALAGHDVIGLANTGTGKTAAFLLPLIHHISENRGQLQAIIIAPTRELAQQIDDDFRTFTKNLNMFSAVCVGGVKPDRQIQKLKRKPHVVIGTPGRLNDFLKQGILKTDKMNILVLDEADRMLDMGFLPDIRRILGALPTPRQSLCFSATITPEIQRLLDDMMVDPVSISVRTSETSDHVQQDVIKVSTKEQKFQVLSELLQKTEFDKVVIFGETKYGVQRLADSLKKDGIPAEAIHGNKTQSQRQRALDAFKANRVKVLVATDVAARGLDIPNVSHVINFDQPMTYDDYVHRIGRTGRAGQRGHALTFIS